MHAIHTIFKYIYVPPSDSFFKQSQYNIYQVESDLYVIQQTSMAKITEIFSPLRSGFSTPASAIKVCIVMNLYSIP
jgi:hypothetical protein